MEGQALPPARRLRTERAWRQDRDRGLRVNSTGTALSAGVKSACDGRTEVNAQLVPAEARPEAREGPAESTQDRRSAGRPGTIRGACHSRLDAGTTLRSVGHQRLANGPHPYGLPCAHARNTPAPARPSSEAHWFSRAERSEARTDCVGVRVGPDPNPPWPTPSSELGEAGQSQGSRQIPTADPLPAAIPIRMHPQGAGEGLARAGAPYYFRAGSPDFFLPRGSRLESPPRF
jgi:hypothetical protein